MLKKSIINCLLVCWLVVMAIDAAPWTCQFHGKLKQDLDPYLDVTGLWQGGWQLFAPEPDKLNSSLTAELVFADGEKVFLNSPKWRELSAWQRLVRFREAEFVDGITTDWNSCAWPTYADYLRRTTPHPNNKDLKATEVLLIRNWVDIMPPNSFTVTEFPEPPEQTSTFIMFAEMYDQED